MRSYSREKRSKNDYCNICGQPSLLTWDHIPPKSCGNSFPVWFNRLMDGIPEYNDYNNKSQNGVRFRSICSRCNNDLLGVDYDPALAQFTNSIVAYIRQASEDATSKQTPLIKLPPLALDAEINKIARAICGHFLSAKNEYDDKNNIDSALRTYFLTPTSLPPKNLSLLFWFYPYSTITIARDYAVARVTSSDGPPLPSGACSSISSFPLAYIICDSDYTGHLPNLFSYCTSNIDEQSTILIDFSSCFMDNYRLLHPLWPSYVSDAPGGVDFLLTTKHTTDSSVLGIRKLSLSALK